MAYVTLKKLDSYGDIRLDLNNKSLESGHTLGVGVTGCAKTFTFTSMIQNQLDNGISSFSIDTTDGLTDKHIPSKFLLNNKHRIRNITVYKEETGISLFDRKVIMVNDKSCYESDADIADRVVNVFGQSLKFGNTQKDTLYNAIISALSSNINEFNPDNKYSIKAEQELKDEYIGLNCVCYCLEEEYSDSSKAVLRKLSRLVNRNLFSKATIDWNDILYGNPTFTNFELSGLSEDLKKLVSEMILLDFWSYITLHGSIKKPCIVWLDEFQKLNLNENSTIASMLALGRKFGVRLWLCTQVITAEPVKSALSKISMAPTKFFYKPSESEAKFIVKTYGIPDVEKLLNLNKGECYATGRFVNKSGELLQSKRVRVKFPEM